MAEAPGLFVPFGTEGGVGTRLVLKGVVLAAVVVVVAGADCPVCSGAEKRTRPMGRPGDDANSSRGHGGAGREAAEGVGRRLSEGIRPPAEQQKRGMAITKGEARRNWAGEAEQRGRPTEQTVGGPGRRKHTTCMCNDERAGKESDGLAARFSRARQWQSKQRSAAHGRALEKRCGMQSDNA